jgi:hypothetical protein
MAKHFTEFSRFMPAVIFFLAGVAVSGIAQAQEQVVTKVVTVIGTGAIFGENVSEARDRAISNSLVSAVARGAEDLLPIDSAVRNFKTFNQTLYGHTEHFIQDYKVLTESVAGEKYRVMVQATVSIGAIKRHLSSAGLRTDQKTLPKVLFLVAEQNLENILPLYWWGEDLVFAAAPSEQAMADEMKKKRFSVIDHCAMVQKKELETLNYNLDLTAQEVAAIGMRFQADVIILGQAKAQKMPNIMGSNLKSFKGGVTARAFRTDTGEQIASTTQTVTAVNTDDIAGSRDALLRAAALAGGELAAQIAEVWVTKEMHPSLVEILVEGTRYLAHFVKLRRIISDLPGVNGVQVKAIQPDEAFMVVDFQGNAKALAKTLMLKTFDAFGITISEISENRLRIELISG